MNPYVLSLLERAAVELNSLLQLDKSAYILNTDDELRVSELLADIEEVLVKDMK